MNKNDRYYKSLLENYEDAAFKLFIYEQAMEDADDMDTEDIPAEVAERADAAYPRMLKLIRHNMNRNNVRNFFVRQLPGLVRGAAALVLVAYIGLTVAIAASGTVRRHVVEYLIQTNDGHNTVGFIETGMEVEVPEGWKANYYMTYIPDGFVLDSTVCDEYICYAKYKNEDGDFLDFQVGSVNLLTNYNTDDGEIVDVEINNTVAQLIVHKSGSNYLVWNCGDKYFMIKTSLRLAETMRVVECVSIIK